MSRFTRVVSVDWAGAGTDADTVDLAVVTAELPRAAMGPVFRDVGGRKTWRWSRAGFERWLTGELRQEGPALVGMDFAFGLPWNADEAVFEVSGWRPMLAAISSRLRAGGTARACANEINAQPRFSGHGPYRFNDSRSDHRFHLEHDVAYYRYAEMFAPQAISQWYLGSGATVGFHSITGMAFLHRLLEKRDRGELDFEVWPHEAVAPSGSRHVLFESYPALIPSTTAPEQTAYGDHVRDAWKVAAYLASRCLSNTISDAFAIREARVGRVADISFTRQVQFEGYIVGLGSPPNA